jgi:hypothetical protein
MRGKNLLDDEVGLDDGWIRVRSVSGGNLGDVAGFSREGLRGSPGTGTGGEEVGPERTELERLSDADGACASGCVGLLGVTAGAGKLVVLCGAGSGMGSEWESEGVPAFVLNMPSSTLHRRRFERSFLRAIVCGTTLVA